MRRSGLPGAVLAAAAIVTLAASAEEAPVHGPSIDPRRAVASPAKPDARPAGAAVGAHAASCSIRERLGVSRTIALDTSGGLHVGLKTYRQTLKLADKEIVLTFDDGPLPGATEKVLDALDAEGVKATFFLIGRNAQANPALVRREAREGHTIGHHSWSHPVRTLRGISPEQALVEIRKGMEAVQIAQTGAPPAGDRPSTPFFRFPGFADTPATLAWLDSHDIATFGTDLWASDWTQQTPEAELALVMKRLNKSRGGILLFHDTRAETAHMLPRFLCRLKEDGYRIVHLTPGEKARDLKDAPAGWTPETEAILAHIMPRLLQRPRPAAGLPSRSVGE